MVLRRESKQGVLKDWFQQGVTGDSPVTPWFQQGDASLTQIFFVTYDLYHFSYQVSFTWQLFYLELNIYYCLTVTMAVLTWS